MSLPAARMRHMRTAAVEGVLVPAGFARRPVAHAWPAQDLTGTQRSTFQASLKPALRLNLSPPPAPVTELHERDGADTGTFTSPKPTVPALRASSIEKRHLAALQVRSGIIPGVLARTETSHTLLENQPTSSRPSITMFADKSTRCPNAPMWWLPAACAHEFELGTELMHTLEKIPLMVITHNIVIHCPSIGHHVSLRNAQVGAGHHQAALCYSLPARLAG